MMIDAATEARRRRNWQFACNSSALSGFETHAEMQAIVERYFKDEISLTETIAALRKFNSQRYLSDNAKQSSH